ncbi:uncharacterized protein LOC142349088 [Convolutriloba macropyga]|uniref:uncharacterized protein LOC142349088 n=1 Tax=Convolutriloba macropyga TaxID=536237 RepID=UPI003F525708
MADLPVERLDASTAFTSVGVEYFGPFTVNIGRRNEKRRCCLFTCLTVRVVHIEGVPKLGTDSCLIAIIRFIAQRGKPTIISNNGTNFVDAEQEFAEYVAAWNREGIEKHLIQKGIRWKFDQFADPKLEGYDQNLQESNVCSLGEQISHRRRSFNYYVYCGTNIECETVDSQGDLLWLIGDSDKRGFYNLGRVTETIEGSDGVIRSSKVRTNDGVFKRPVVKLTPVLPNKKDVFVMENRAGDVKANH